MRGSYEQQAIEPVRRRRPGNPIHDGVADRARRRLCHLHADSWLALTVQNELLVASCDFFLAGFAAKLALQVKGNTDP